MFGKSTAFIIRIKWLVVAIWVAAAALLFLTAPKLADIVSTDSGSFLPANSKTAEANKLIKSLFPDSVSHTSLVLVISSESGLTAADDEYVQAFDTYFTRNKESLNIGDIMSPGTSAAMKTQLKSKDGKVSLVYLNVNAVPYSDQATNTLKRVNSVINSGKIELDGTARAEPRGLSIYVTGDAAISSEQHEATKTSMAIVTKITILLLLLILILIYRSPVAPLLPLLTIGLSFIISRGLIGFLTLGGFKISTFTETFLIAVLFGAGTDYCMLILSRFKEELSHGKDRNRALIDAMPNTGVAVVSSGGTVVVGFLFMIFARFGLFSTTGPSVAIGVGVTILAVLTLIPAFIAVIGEKVFWPAKDFTLHNESLRTGFWGKLARKVTAMPVRFLLIPLLLFVPFIYSATGMTISYDNMKDLPAETSSIKGFTVMSEHFQKGDLLPVRVTLKTDKNLYGTDSLKIIDAITENLLKVENVDVVRSATRPLGEKLTQASLGSQITLLSGGMKDVGSGFSPIMDGITSLRKGIDQVAEGLGAGGSSLQADLGGSVGRLQSGISVTQDGLARLRAGTDQSVTGINEVSVQLSTLSAGTAKTAEGVKKLAALVDSAISALGKMVAADPKLQMNMDFQTAFGTLKAVSQNFGGVEASLAQIGGGISQTTAGLTQIGGGLAGVGGGIQASSEALARINSGLSAMKSGAEKAGVDLGTAANALKQISAGTGSINENLKKMEAGLSKINNAAKDYGSTLSDVFYLPAYVFTEYPEFKSAVSKYLSPDGKGATFDLVLSVTPYSTAALDSIGKIRDAMSFSLKNTSLEGSTFATSGISSTFADVRDLVSSDMTIVIIFVLTGIFIILALLLKSIVAPIYLLLTTLLSYVSTLGISYLFFCRILGQDGLHWSVPFFSFCVLVALGVDYNIFLITRVKEEYVPGKMREGITKALATTGGIITSCGIIMAGTFGSMMFSPMRPMVQVGFAACVGIIIDTFVIRSLVVPAIAVLVGEMSWWPGRKVIVTSLDRKKQAAP